MRALHTAATPPSAWPPQVPPPTLTERRGMKKAAQPEHSYTGHIPKWLVEADEPHSGGQQASQQQNQRTRNAPILGYSGHLRHEEDRVGTTFSKGLEIAKQPVAAPAGPLTRPFDEYQRRLAADNNKDNNNRTRPEETKKKVTFHDDHRNANISQGRAVDPATRTTPTATREAVGFGAYNDDAVNGDFQAKPMSTRSGYGAFDGVSGYGEFAAKPMSARSGYGAFDGASGYGEFAAKPMSARSGYGAFDGASGYGEFAAKPMSARSGYGAFDAASGYGEFMAPPGRGRGPDAMSERSGYGAFDGASGYGAFQARPEEEEDNDSQGYGAFDGDAGNSVAYGDFLSPGSGNGQFMAAPEVSQPTTKKSPLDHKASTAGAPPSKPRAIVVKQNEALDRKYQCALRAVGGEAKVHKLLDAFAATVARRHHKRTELLQAIKRNFEKHEQQNQGKMTKAHVKEALEGLACVFTDDQIMALMAVYDPKCRGYVSMDTLLNDLTKRAIS